MEENVSRAKTSPQFPGARSKRPGGSLGFEVPPPPAGLFLSNRYWFRTVRLGISAVEA